MKKRLIAAIAAGALALLGVIVLITWANNANERAFRGADLVEVVRVTAAVESGTKAEDLGKSTEIAKLPADSIPDGAVTKLSEVTGMVATTSLETGEVLLKSRLAAPGTKAENDSSVPKGFQEISIALDTQRTVAGVPKAGDRVAVIASFDPKNDPQFTNLIRHNVLVTKISAGATAEEGLGSIVTLAVKTRDAEKIAFAMEFGKVWLTKQNVDTEKLGEKVITGGDFK